jgi:hypothetical protein
VGELALRVLEGIDFKGSVEFSDFELFFTLFAILIDLPLFLPFAGFCGFPSSRWPCWVFLGFFGLLAVIHGFWIRTSNFVHFVVNEQWEIKKSSGQFFGLTVMSHWLDEVWIRIRDISVILSLSLFHLENHVCLSRGV